MCRTSCAVIMRKTSLVAYTVEQMAKELEATSAGLAIASDALKAGSCVAFPTETVYGLGANALDADSVLKIFEYKGRPLTDPLIVHVPSADSAESCITLSETARHVFRILTEKFWPGPLTIVARARAHIPPAITANTGWVGVRVPAHPVALALLEACGLPIAAPSANRFGHVSPTRPEHVISDLGQHPIYVLRSDGDASAVACAVGIESTVVKLWQDEARPLASGSGHDGPVRLTILRRGGVSIEELQAAFHGAGSPQVLIDVVKGHAPAATVHATGPATAAALQSATAGAGAASSPAPEVGDEAPGMSVTHYAPDVEAVLVTSDTAQPPLANVALHVQELHQPLAQAIVLDYAGCLSSLQPSCLAYRDLSPSGDVFEARSRVFDSLRWTEGVPGAKLVLLADPLMVSISDGKATLGHAEAVRDRLFRAASGKVMDRARLLKS